MPRKAAKIPKGTEEVVNKEIQMDYEKERSEVLDVKMSSPISSNIARKSEHFKNSESLLQSDVNTINISKNQLSTRRLSKSLKDKNNEVRKILKFCDQIQDSLIECGYNDASSSHTENKKHFIRGKKQEKNRLKKKITSFDELEKSHTLTAIVDTEIESQENGTDNSTPELLENSHLIKSKQKQITSDSNSSEQKKTLITKPSSLPNSQTEFSEKNCKVPRSRIPPLQSWRNEYRSFLWKDGQMVDIIHHQGNAVSTVAEKKILKNRERYLKAKKRVKKITKAKLLTSRSNLLKITNEIFLVPVNNPNTEDVEEVYLNRPYKTQLWTVPQNQDKTNPSFIISKYVSNEQISFGFIEISVSKCKEKQISPTDNLHFVLIQGIVRMRVNEIDICVNEKDTVIVPVGNSYSVHNTGKIPAILHFTSFKAPLFDS